MKIYQKKINIQLEKDRMTAKKALNSGNKQYEQTDFIFFMFVLAVTSWAYIALLFTTYKWLFHLSMSLLVVSCTYFVTIGLNYSCLLSYIFLAFSNMFFFRSDNTLLELFKEGCWFVLQKGNVDVEEEEISGVVAGQNRQTA